VVGSSVVSLVDVVVPVAEVGPEVLGDVVPGSVVPVVEPPDVVDGPLVVVGSTPLVAVLDPDVGSKSVGTHSPENGPLNSENRRPVSHASSGKLQ
jgi:hypothetical protein